MHRNRWPLRIAALALALVPAPAATTAGAGTPTGAGDVVRLFNGKDLDGWTVWIQHADKSVAPAVDPKGVFRVEDGILHVSGEEFGGLTTAREFSDYRLTVEFKWGEKRWPPRQDAKRDSGILLHCNGPDKVWTRSIECQIQEGDCGDFWLVDGTAITVAGKRVASGRVVKAADGEQPTGRWNTVEVVCDGGKITNIVNGVVVNEGTDASVTRGKILLQSEGAEVDYRKVELRPLRR